MTNICLYQRQFCPTRAPYGAITITRSPDTRTPTVTGLTTRAPPKIQMKDNHGELPFLYQHFSRSGLFQVCCFFLNYFLKVLSWTGVPLRLTRMAMWWIMPGETVLMAVLAHVSMFESCWCIQIISAFLSIMGAFWWRQNFKTINDNFGVNDPPVHRCGVQWRILFYPRR